MRVTIGVNRKEGRPGYGSEGASCELTLDLSEQSVSANPASLADEIRRAYALAEQVVGEQLARHQVDVDPRGPRPVIEPDRDRQPSQARPPSQPEPTRQPPAGQYDPRIGPDGAARFKTDGRPKSGRELLGWSRKQDPSVFKRLCQYGKAVGFPDLMNAWDASQTSEAFYAVTGGPDQYDAEPEPEPAYNGRNGHATGQNGWHR